ncbi:MAG: phytoene desaturase family protein [Bacteroidota bacterium]
MPPKRVTILGAGFAGLSAAATLAKEGYQVKVYDKNAKPGGRAQNFSAQGFTFDMGPTWYWMPDIFEDFFAYFGKKVSDYYELVRISPSYRMFFGKDDYIDLPTSMDEVYDLFEKLEPGSSIKLKKFLADAEYKYNLGIKEIVRKPAKRFSEFLEYRIVSGIFRLDFFKSITTYIKQNFKNHKLIKLLEFPVIFLGATPQNTPALYSLMNYADIKLGTWYPMGGMYSVVNGMVELGKSMGVEYHLGKPVDKINIHNRLAHSIQLNGSAVETDYVIGAADYNHIEANLLDPPYRNYSAKYWENRDMAPSALLFYLGINKKLKNLEHHNLFFDEDFEQHAAEIYNHPTWPTKPALYVSCSSKTDATVAPEGHENLIILIPVAPGLEDTNAIKEHYFEMSIERLEKITGQSIKGHIVYKRFYAQSDFIRDYNSFKGNAYGLANTLRQTAFLKPKIHNRKVRNIFYAGQLTTPGPGVPPTIISGQVAAKEIMKVSPFMNEKQQHHETSF